MGTDGQMADGHNDSLLFSLSIHSNIYHGSRRRDTPSVFNWAGAGLGWAWNGDG
jgi:hypothetical protein